MKSKKFTASVISVVLLLTGASSALLAQQTASSARSISENVGAERIVNIDVLRQKLRRYHDCTCTCGCYTRDLDLQADRAIAFLHRRVAHKRAGEKLAMVLDIDETALSNYEELNQSSFTYVKRDFYAWIDTAKAPAIPGTLRLFNEARKLGVSVFFITGRPESQRGRNGAKPQAAGLHELADVDDAFGGGCGSGDDFIQIFDARPDYRGGLQTDSERRRPME